MRPVTTSTSIAAGDQVSRRGKDSLTASRAMATERLLARCRSSPIRPLLNRRGTRTWRLQALHDWFLRLQPDFFVAKLKPPAVEQRIRLAVSSWIERIRRIETGDFRGLQPKPLEIVLAAPCLDDAQCIGRPPQGIQLVAAFDVLQQFVDV